MDLLPTDVLREVIFFKFLPMHYWLLCCFVCKKWRNIGYSLIDDFIKLSKCYYAPRRPSIKFFNRDALVYSLYLEGPCCILEWFDTTLKYQNAFYANGLLDDACVRLAAINGYAACIDSLRRTLPYFTKRVLPLLAFAGHAALLKQQIAVLPPTDISDHVAEAILHKAARGGQLHIIKSLYSDVGVGGLNPKLLYKSAKSGSIEAFEFFWRIYTNRNGQALDLAGRNELFVAALKSDNYRVLDYLQQLKLLAEIEPTGGALRTVILCDYLSSFKWLHRTMPTFIQATINTIIEYAANLGSIRVLEYIHQQVKQIDKQKLQIALRVDENKRRIV